MQIAKTTFLTFLMATGKIHVNSMNSTHSAGGAKIALDPGLNSLEVTRQE